MVRTSSSGGSGLGGSELQFVLAATGWSSYASGCGSIGRNSKGEICMENVEEKLRGLANGYISMDGRMMTPRGSCFSS